MIVPESRHRFRAKIWRHDGPAAWHFVTLPKKISTRIHRDFARAAADFGSLPVTVTLRDTHWQTSIFRDTRLKAYVLPVKAAIRNKERLQAGQTVTLEIKIHATAREDAGPSR